MDETPSEEIQVAVIGDRLDDVGPLLGLLAFRAEKELSVYSQQMFIAMLGTEADPLAADLDRVPSRLRAQ